MRTYPIFLTSCGVLIHLIGLFGINFSETPDWLHLVMLIVDSATVVGLLLKSIGGNWLGITLYIQQTICQSYWYLQSREILSIQILIPLLCFAALVCLLLTQKNNSNTANQKF